MRVELPVYGNDDIVESLPKAKAGASEVESVMSGGELLSKNAVSGKSPEEQYSLHSGLVREYAEDRYHRQSDQRARWLAEHQHHEAMEKALADVSKFNYEPVNYPQQLVKEPFLEPERSDFKPLLPERLLAAEQRYRRPILIQWSLMVACLLSAVFFPYLVTVVLAALLLAVLAFLQYSTLRERKRVLAETERDTRLEIEKMMQQQEEEIQEKRRVHDAEEEERLEFYLRLMKGDATAILETLEEYLPEAAVPFPMDVSIELYGGALLVRAWLPPQELLPSERTSLAESGKIQYYKKSSTEINKQYAELCAAILMQVATTIFSKIPTLEVSYFWGMRKDANKDECVMSMWVDRTRLASVFRYPTALGALQGLSSVYKCDENLKLLPVEPVVPDEWAAVDRKWIQTVQIKIYKWILPGMRNKRLENN